MVVPLLLLLIILSIVTILLYKHYGWNGWKGRAWYIPAATMLGWYLAMWVVILVPIDVVSSEYDQCVNETRTDCVKPFSYLSLTALKVFWRIVYWSNYIALWLIYPILQSYSIAPHFKEKHKWLSAIKDNLLIYGIALGVGLVGLIIILIRYGSETDFAKIQGLAMALANTVGLILLIILMGIGLVNVPRKFWRISNHAVTLKMYQFQAAQFSQEYQEARIEMLATFKQIKKYNDSIRSHDPYRKYIDNIIAKCPPEYSQILMGEGECEVNYNNLVALHQRFMLASKILTRTKVVYEELLKNSFDLEDILSSTLDNNQRTINWTFRQKRTHRFAGFFNRFEFLWHKYFRSISLKFGCLLLVLLSIATVWTECTFFVYGVTKGKVNLSLFSLILPNTLSSFWKQVFIFVPVCYISLCAYSSLLIIRVFNLYRFVPHGQTDSPTLIFSAQYFGKLAPVIAYNFLLMIHICAHCEGHTSAFSTIMGDMTAIPFFGFNFNYYFPIILIVLVIATLTNICNYLMGLCKIKTFRYDEDQNDESIQAGMDIIHNERERLSTRGIDVESNPTNEKKFPDVWGIFNRGNSQKIGGNKTQTKTRVNNSSPSVNHNSNTVELKDDFKYTSKLHLISHSSSISLSSGFSSTDDGLENAN
eukprot:TRINITY_DN1595_c0_g1_i1.p1 TRINITY_DN1595_c0_g1~~TRINITY_DN1595_c0_g1_i1.p1  ORF type:complete len:647 (-),score=138.75 TRINITY_DN1595_c0_g1_i1:54-1994(-)